MASPEGQSEKENAQPPVSDSSCRAIRSSFLSQNGENGLEIGDIWPSDGHHDDDDVFEKNNGKMQEESKHLVDENITAEGGKQSSSSTCKWFDLVDQYMHVQGVPGNDHNAGNDDDRGMNNGEAHIVGSIDNDVLGHAEEVMNSNPVGTHNGGLGHVEEVVNPNPVVLASSNAKTTGGPIALLSHAEEVNNASVVVNVNTNANVSDTLMLDHASCPESVVGIVPNNRIHEPENTAKRARREQQIKESLCKMVRTWRDSLEVLKDLETTRIDTLQRLSSTMTGLLDVLKK